MHLHFLPRLKGPRHTTGQSFLGRTCWCFRILLEMMRRVARKCQKRLQRNLLRCAWPSPPRYTQDRERRFNVEVRKSGLTFRPIIFSWTVRSPRSPLTHVFIPVKMWSWRQTWIAIIKLQSSYSSGVDTWKDHHCPEYVFPRSWFSCPRSLSPSLRAHTHWRRVWIVNASSTIYLRRPDFQTDDITGRHSALQYWHRLYERECPSDANQQVPS